jgi:hypothetical protein
MDFYTLQAVEASVAGYPGLKNTFQEKGFFTWDAAIASNWWMV